MHILRNKLNPIVITFSCLTIFHWTAIAAPSQYKKLPSPPATKIVKVSGRQLIVDGKPFVMKGVVYNPVRKGETHPAGLITLHPTQKELKIIEGDFKMMHEAGINTIRPFEPITDPRVLDLLLKYELRMIVPIGTNCKMGLYDFSSTIEILKDHPATLIWEIGNEWNYNCFYSTEKGGSGSKGTVLNFKECVSLVKAVSACIKALDTKHPVSTDIGNIPEDHKELQRLFQSVDLCGMNVYDGLTFGDRFQVWKTLTNKPLYIGECGADSYNELTHSYDPKDQAIATRSLIQKVLNNLSAKNKNHVLVGACLFEWCDEWWKAKGSTESLSEHTTGGFKVDQGGPYPDRFFNEEWWGILSINREPRPAYFALKELFTSIPPVSKNNPKSYLPK